MTITVGVFEAKTRLSELLELAATGERIVVTKRGVPFATIGPPPTREDQIKEFIELAREIRSRTKPGPETAKELIEEGRRY
ncbi:MAG: type II toxin-antitoxin system prevent-host-death family antitoxin [Actinomycetes bacterium]